MLMTNLNNVESFLAAYPPQVQEIAEAARGFLNEVLPGAEESVDESARLLAYSYGPGYKGLVCTLIMSQKGVKLGINKGAELPDPEKLLEGSGKVHKYVQLRRAADLEQAGLRELLEEAARRRKGGELTG
jgi:hypothetical protein